MVCCEAAALHCAYRHRVRTDYSELHCSGDGFSPSAFCLVRAHRDFSCLLYWCLLRMVLEMTPWSNKADAQNPAMTSLFQIGRHRRRVCDLRR